MRSKFIIYLVEGLSRLPLIAVQRLGALLGWFFYRIPNREKAVARININLCFPELNTPQRERLLRQCLIENAKTLLEMPRIWRG
ncbi:MAG TPA: lipid A biosynthesis acyltransferase, partial [Gammaproteobacteria bacterium]|nr:lipid A biosynthesis acyltransferase [Gammaproteobacteria bacterium]